MLFRNAGSRPGVWTMRVGAVAAGLAFLVATAPEGRAAPVPTDGCASINAGGFDGVATGAQMSDTRTITGFNPGDRVTVVIEATNIDPNTWSQWSVYNGRGTTVMSDAVSADWTYTTIHTVTDDDLGSLSQSMLVHTGGSPSQRWEVTATCVPGPKPVVGPTASDKVRGVQVQGSMQAASVSGAVMTDAVSGATSDAFANGGAPITMSSGGIVMNFTADVERQQASDPRNKDVLNALAYAGDARKAPRAMPVLDKSWSLWANIRGSGFDRINASALDQRGTQLNATAGIGYKLRPDLLIGLFAGYESFTYDFAAVSGRLKGDGGTIGGYVGWKITPSLRWDVMAGWTGLSYDASAGAATGSFSGSRWIASTGLTGTHRVAGFTLEPSLKVFALWEHQKDWTDSLGTLQTARDFTTGRVSAGGRVLTPASRMVIRQGDAVHWSVWRLGFLQRERAAERHRSGRL